LIAINATLKYFFNIASQKNDNMNKTFTLIATLFCAAAIKTSAQLVTISATHQLPAIGDTIRYVDANTFGFNQNGTGPVTNTLWDNALLMNAGTNYIFFYEDPATITGNGVDSFPGATLARGESGAAGYFYYQNTANDINRIGWYSSASNYGVYNAGTYATEFHFPMTAGQTVNSSYSGRYAPFGLGEDSCTLESGSLAINADQQGTLILPTGTFTNVLRIHAIETFHIKIYMMGVPVIDYLVSDDYYYWFHDTIKQPLLTYGITTIDGTAQTPVLRYQPISGTTGLSQLAQQNEINISPNPSSGQFLISDFSLTQAGNIEIYNAVGQKVNFNITSVGNNTLVKLLNNTKGVYLIKLMNQQSVLTRKVVVE
jgi:hypothetical protein